MTEQQNSPKRCRACNLELKPEARLCLECKAWQKYPRRLIAFSPNVLSLLVALVSAIWPATSALSYFLDRNSRTSLMVTSIGTNTISLYAWNSGRKPSRVTKCVLDFGSFPYETVEVELYDKTKSIVPASGLAPAPINGTAFDLRLQPLRRRCTGAPSDPNASLLCDVQESNDDHNMQRVQFSEPVISDLIVKKKQLGQVLPCE